MPLALSHDHAARAPWLHHMSLRLGAGGYEAGKSGAPGGRHSSFSANAQLFSRVVPATREGAHAVSHGVFNALMPDDLRQPTSTQSRFALQ